ncbi:MAG: hypothetical protein PVJ76_12095, partial [Gemmatimonadota bacterium]
MVFRILSLEFKAKKSAEGPRGKRALKRKADPMADNAASRGKISSNGSRFCCRARCMGTPGSKERIPAEHVRA